METHIVMQYFYAIILFTIILCSSSWGWVVFPDTEEAATITSGTQSPVQDGEGM
jgi:hypothetical protein